MVTSPEMCSSQKHAYSYKWSEFFNASVATTVQFVKATVKSLGKTERDLN